MPSCQTFFKFITHYFAKVSFPKQTKLGVCDLCVQLWTQKLLVVTEAEKRTIWRQMREHTCLQKAEHSSYYLHAHDSERAPDQSWSVIMDMSDKFLAPHKVIFLTFYIMYVDVLYNIINFYMQSRMPKEWLSLFQLLLLCHGLIDHSNKTHQLTWFLPTIKQNPNLTISILYKLVWLFQGWQSSSSNIILAGR